MQVRCGQVALALLFALPGYSGDLNDDLIGAAQCGDLPRVQGLLAQATPAAA